MKKNIKTRITQEQIEKDKIDHFKKLVVPFLTIPMSDQIDWDAFIELNSKVNDLDQKHLVKNPWWRFW